MEKNRTAAVVAGFLEVEEKRRNGGWNLGRKVAVAGMVLEEEGLGLQVLGKIMEKKIR